MADTLSNIILPKGVWVDVYDATGITTGTKISVQNLTTSHVRLVTSSTQPTDTTGFNTIPPYYTAVNDALSTGEWAFSSNGGAINVKEVVI